MNILFLHGLESKLSQPKRELLEQYGTVIAPDLEYKTNSDIINMLHTQFQNKNIDAIIGSSMGGFTGFYLSKLLRVPALLFNPALPSRNAYQAIPETEAQHNHLLQFVIGNQDDIVDPQQNLEFIIKYVARNADLKIHIINSMQHRIPIEILGNEAKSFFGALAIVK